MGESLQPRESTGGNENSRPRMTRRAFITCSLLGIGAASAATAGVVLGRPVHPRSSGAALDKLSTFPELDGTLTDATGVIARYLQDAQGIAVLRGTYYLDGPVEVPHNVTQLVLPATSALHVRGNHPALTRMGKVTFRETTWRDMPEKTVRLDVRNSSLYKAGETVLLSGANVVPNSKDRYGYLRRVTAVDAGTISIDAPLPRTIDDVARTSSVELAPPLWVSGSGQIMSDDPSAMFSPLVHFFATEGPKITGVRVGHSGAAGVTLSHCMGGLIDCEISDLLDDGEAHFGYGVNITGATRDARVLGRMSRVRHAVTTNTGQHLGGVGYAGEPENCYFAPQASDCSNKAIDTHRVGWGIVIVPHVVGGNGGVQVRSDNATVKGGSVEGSSGPGIFVSSVVKVPTSISDVSVSALSGGQTGILCKGPAEISDARIDLTGGTGIEIFNDSTVSRGSVIGTPDTGLAINGVRNTVDGLAVGPTVRRQSVVVKPDDNNRVLLAAAPMR
ncbi:hypothetical protein [Herbiconiux sp. A18JL235]|uniref:Right-handed parallel beta-helix repeat-containing protein n=1 Tax=Herbiconiux sp. A18JL235 TaxID=3152363 RepID=A0AB39BJN6_9MICO